MTAGTTRPTAREVVFTRRFESPPALVWRAWSDPRHLHEWFGPEGFTTTTDEFAFVPGGVWRFTMHGPDGTDYPNVIVFREIEPPARLVYANTWNLPGDPLDFEVRVTFTPDGTGTRLAIHFTFSDARAMRTAVERYGVIRGGEETMERMAGYLGEGRWGRERR